MAVPARITDTSATAANNSPSGGTVVGSVLDDYLRGIQAAFRGDLAYVGANIATAATPDIGAIQGSYHLMTGNTTITGFVSGDPGVVKVLEADSTMPLIHSTTLPLIDSSNMTLQPGEVTGFVAKAGGVWKQLWINRGSTIPVGSVMPYAGATAPTGWLLCDGSAVSRSTYSALSSLLSSASYPYGSGNGSTTFNLPDLRGRAVFGKDNMGGSAASRVTAGVSGVTGTTLGNAGGSEYMHGHTHSITDSGHTHGHNANAANGAGASGATFTSPTTQAATIDASPTGISIVTAGSGASQNLPPGMILNYIIKT